MELHWWQLAPSWSEIWREIWERATPQTENELVGFREHLDPAHLASLADFFGVTVRSHTVSPSMVWHHCLEGNPRNQELRVGKSPLSWSPGLEFRAI